MKIYICDICGKEFGRQIDMYLSPAYAPNNFDSKFYARAKTEADICGACCDRIARAQQTEIEKIKNETGKG